MKSELLAVMFLSMVSTVSYAGLTDSLNKGGSTDLKTMAESKSKDAAKGKANKEIAIKVNKKLLSESRKNQCSFKSGTDELEKGCGSKSKKLANQLIDVKKSLQSQGYSGFKFIVSGHTDSSGDAAKNKDLSTRRAQVMVKELVAQGVEANDIEAVGKGSEKMLVKPDDTPAKKAKNRRYEVQIRF